MIYSNRKFNPAAFSQRKLVAGIAAPPIIRMRSFPRHRGLGNHVQSIIKITADRGKDRSKAESRNTIEDDLSGGWALAGNLDGSLSNYVLNYVSDIDIDTRWSSLAGNLNWRY